MSCISSWQPTGPSSTAARGSRDVDSESGSEEESEPFAPETDQDRRRTLLDSLPSSDAEGLKASTQDFADEFVFPESRGVWTTKKQGSTATNPSPSDGKGKGKVPRDTPPAAEPLTAAKSSKRESSKMGTPKAPAARPLTEFFTVKSTGAHTGDDAPPQKKQKMIPLAYGDIVRDEVQHRKREALGMSTGSSRTLGAGKLHGDKDVSAGNQANARLLQLSPNSESNSKEDSQDESDTSWSCLVCTLYVLWATTRWHDRGLTPERMLSPQLKPTEVSGVLRLRTTERRVDMDRGSTLIAIICLRSWESLVYTTLSPLLCCSFNHSACILVAGISRISMYVTVDSNVSSNKIRHFVPKTSSICSRQCVSVEHHVVE